MYERALALGPEPALRAGECRARRSEKLGHAAEAERLYRRALAVDPRSGDAANKLGLLLAKAGRTDEARRLFELAISIRRDDSSAINNLGVLYINTGQTNDADRGLPLRHTGGAGRRYTVPEPLADLGSHGRSRKGART